MLCFFSTVILSLCCFCSQPVFFSPVLNNIMLNGLILLVGNVIALFSFFFTWVFWLHRSFYSTSVSGNRGFVRRTHLSPSAFQLYLFSCFDLQQEICAEPPVQLTEQRYWSINNSNKKKTLLFTSMISIVDRKNHPVPSELFLSIRNSDKGGERNLSTITII